jgi:hypothetical protein
MRNHDAVADSPTRHAVDVLSCSRVLLELNGIAMLLETGMVDR